MPGQNRPEGPQLGVRVKHAGLHCADIAFHDAGDLFQRTARAVGKRQDQALLDRQVAQPLGDPVPQFMGRVRIDQGMQPLGLLGRLQRIAAMLAQSLQRAMAGAAWRLWEIGFRKRD